MIEEKFFSEKLHVKQLLLRGIIGRNFESVDLIPPEGQNYVFLKLQTGQLAKFFAADRRLVITHSVPRGEFHFPEENPGVLDSKPKQDFRDFLDKFVSGCRVVSGIVPLPKSWAAGVEKELREHGIGFERSGQTLLIHSTAANVSGIRRLGAASGVAERFKPDVVLTFVLQKFSQFFPTQVASVIETHLGERRMGGQPKYYKIMVREKPSK